MFEICFIGFSDLKNIEKDTYIMKISEDLVDLHENTRNVAAIFIFDIFRHFYHVNASNAIFYVFNWMYCPPIY